MMMRTVNVHEAKTHLSRLLEAVENGEDIVISDDVDQMPEGLLAAFEGRSRL